MDGLTETAEALLTAYENQVRGVVPRHRPWGAVVERDGPLLRTHYGTHGSVDHAAATTATTATAALWDDLPGLIGRQQEVFAARREPVEWKVHSHDTPQLAASLRETGFTPGPERALLVAGIADTADAWSPGALPPGTRIQGWPDGEPRQGCVRRMAANAPEQRRPLAEMEADGTGRITGSEMTVLALEHEGRVLDALWAERLGGTGFAAIGGMTGPRPELLHATAAWASWRLPRVAPAAGAPRHLLAEAPSPGHPPTWRRGSRRSPGSVRTAGRRPASRPRTVRHDSFCPAPNTTRSGSGSSHASR
ncbi:hypothetical protein [Streptomyces sp. MST-110588]|uniref:hypothetical protein n=1 Tax=Streptomyces sp. MST-110588 TaxID=2833628 RepID=UPI001F5D4D2E|nr:hypothetical protein [Streptomyces sp. MST-110588]